VLEAELTATLLHLEGARKAIENAQSWATRWRAHAFNMKSERDRWRDMAKKIDAK